MDNYNPFFFLDITQAAIDEKEDFKKMADKSNANLSKLEADVSMLRKQLKKAVSEVVVKEKEVRDLKRFNVKVSGFQIDFELFLTMLL